MLFTTYEFLFVFLPIVLFIYHIIKNSQLRLIFLTISSYFFYGYWNYKFLPLLFISSYLDFIIGKKIGDAKNDRVKKNLLILSVSMNLGLLGFFKYFNFLMDNFNLIASLFGDFRLQHGLEIVLPVGISFYTFQSMSYTIDVYRDHSKPYENLFAFLAYVSLFPQLIAGPIIRHTELVEQIQESVKHKVSWDKIEHGVFFFVFGLSKKILIADRIGLAIDPVLANISNASLLEAWICALGYTIQLYFDFSGYSDMAIGLGKLLGLDFPFNFNSPYKSKSITEFWRRWHMTLSFWLRDYLYISLGGSRKSPSRTYVNLFLTMLLGGLWHGAGWNFVLWGAFHGALLGIERKFEKFKNFNFPFKTFFLVLIGWISFRATSLDHLKLWVLKLIDLSSGFHFKLFTASSRDRFAIALLIGLILAFKAKNTQEIIADLKVTKFKIVFLALIFVLSLLYFSKDSPFLYFQF